MNDILLFFLSFIVSLIALVVVKKLVEKFGFYDHPTEELKQHERPIPYVGAAVWLSFMIMLLFLRLSTSFETGTLHSLRGIVYGGTMIFALGILDDILDLHFVTKFIFQIAAAGILVSYQIRIDIFPSLILNILFSVFWLVLVINAVNIIDIKDGLASGVAFIAAIGFYAVTLPTEHLYVNFAALILAGVLLGFWLFNKPPAKVFLGDAGSLFIGFILAALSMGAEYSMKHPVGLSAPLLILGIPIYDTLLVSFFRFRSGKSIFKGSNDHYALRLECMGFSVWQIDLISYLISAVLALTAFAITQLPAGPAFVVMALVFFAALIGSAVLGTVKVKD